MSKKYKNNTDSEAIKYFKDLIAQYIDEIKSTIREYLEKKYEKPPDQIEAMVGTVMEAVITDLRKKYIFRVPIRSFGPTSLFLLYEDFNHWLIVVTMIPFYHSLGDTLGYYNGKWEFNYGQKVTSAGVNEKIYEFISLGGVNDISIVNWLSSDDTILYLATYQVLVNGFEDINDFGKKLKKSYLEAVPLIKGRHPGKMTMQSLSQQKIKWNELEYDSSAIGAGAAMRSGCIGIFYPGKHNRDMLISLAIESSRITHNSAIAILGAVTTALFTAYAIERVPVNHWPHKLLKLLKSGRIDRYMEKSRPKEYYLYSRDKILYYAQWEKYITMRFSGLQPISQPIYKNPVSRFEHFSSNFSKGHEDFPFSTGDDCVIMAYDSLLESDGVFEKLLVYSVLHPGDSDTVGCIAFSLYGAYYHPPKYPDTVYDKLDKLEFSDRIYNLTQSNMDKMIETYYYHIYLDQAIRVIKRMRF